MDTNTQPTIWEVSDNVWTIIELILNKYYPAKTKGHRRVDLRPVLNGVIFCRCTQPVQALRLSPTLISKLL
jgi:hypothetical protein